ncbi:hypothetical protein ABID92_000805 [Frigoribacterium sp. PvP120]|uniref:hypothetical protein n=1 Tax=unclassified Frigoribacterium TaxID=2627005 RepID=UPI001AE652D1|nr:hypothetical protein [Frigoribacterium sp. PvP121]MBP1241366.1 hypothetical protein [Frigoribacterium sp. PvP121]
MTDPRPSGSAGRHDHADATASEQIDRDVDLDLDDDGADDALSWGDESDASHVEGPAAATHDDEIDPDAPQVMSSASLVGHGVLGGVALLSSVGWIVSRDQFLVAFGGGLVEHVQTTLWLTGVFLALVAPLLWFVAVILLVPSQRSGRRLLVMAVGAVLLAPWPLVIGGGA